MEDERFSWNDDKATSNVEKHEVPFQEAVKALDDVNKVEWWDEEHSTTREDRFMLIGHSGARLLVVVYTERGSRKHIITAWKAEKDDRKIYERQRR